MLTQHDRRYQDMQKHVLFALHKELAEAFGPLRSVHTMDSLMGFSLRFLQIYEKAHLTLGMGHMSNVKDPELLLGAAIASIRLDLVPPDPKDDAGGSRYELLDWNGSEGVTVSKPDPVGALVLHHSRHTVKVPESHPRHDTVGKYYGAYDDKNAKVRLYFVDNYHSWWGFTLRDVFAPARPRRDVSERAIDRTVFLAIRESDDEWYIPQWGTRIKAPTTGDEEDEEGQG